MKPRFATLLCCVLLTSLALPCLGQLYNFTINTAVGTYTYGDDGPATSALLAFPHKATVGPNGALYIADGSNNKVRKVASGQITTVAGTGVPGYSGDGGPASAAQLSNPTGVAVDSAGNVYIVDSGNAVVRKVDASGNISTFAGAPQVPGATGDGGPATQAKLSPDGGIAFDSSGNLYIADTFNDAIRKVTMSTGVITTVAGTLGNFNYSGDNGPATSAGMMQPVGLAFDSTGNLYIVDRYNCTVRMVVAVDGAITAASKISTYAGTVFKCGASGAGGPPGKATLDAWDVAVDGQNNVYFADLGNSVIWKATPGAQSTISIFAGSTQGFGGDGGPATSANFQWPEGVAVDSGGTIYVTDTLNSRIRTISAGTVREFAGADHAQGDSGKATEALLYFPQHLTWDAQGNLYVADTKNNRVRRITPSGIISTVAGNGSYVASGDGGPATSAGVNQPQAVAVDASGNVYILTESRVRMVDSKGNISTIVNTANKPGFAGDGGPAAQAELSSPFGLIVDSSGNLYIADTYNHRIRKVSGGTISTVAGSGPVFPPGVGSFGGDGGLATAANLAFPYDIALDNSGNLLIVDAKNFVIRSVNNKTGIITTVAGTPRKPGFSGDLGPATAAQLNNPLGIALDSANNIYISDGSNAVVRMVDAFGVISTIGGDNKLGFSGDGGPGDSASLDYPFGIGVDPGGNVWFADINNHRIRELSPSGPVVPNASSVVNAASFVSGGLVPGGMATIFGSNLTSAKGINEASGLPLATTLQNVSVKFNNTVEAPVFAVDNVNNLEQINIQVPWELAKFAGSNAIMQVTNNGSTGVPVQVPVLAAQPGIFAYNVGANTFGVVLHANFQLADSAHPVAGGETVLIYCTNLGAVAPAIADGAPGTGKELTVTKPAVTIGGAAAAVSFSGLAPGFVGLNQINVEVPKGLAAGNQPLVVTTSGASSKTVLLPVK